MAPNYDNFDEEDAIMRDVSPEEMSAAMDASTKYVSKVFLEASHYEKIHKTLSSHWDRLNSLSAAMKLMENYGVTLSASEEARLKTLDEGQQINALVSKMPQQNNEQFQQFFLQLQLLVSTAMRVRRSLEEGRPDEVEAALNDAEATGIAQYILRVAIVQAGSEVQAIKNQFEGWTQEADGKMGRLMRGQQDNLTAQKKLAEAEASLSRQNGEQNSKAARAVLNCAKGNDKAMILLILQQWQTTTKHLRLEAELRIEYADRLQDLEDNLAKWKAGQASASQNLMLKKIKQDQEALIGHVFDVWRKDVEDLKWMKENGEKLAQLEEKLANAKSSQKENATKVMGGMAAASDKGLCDIVLKSWVQLRLDTIKSKKDQEDRMNNESKLDKFTTGKSEEAKFLVQNFAGANNTGLLHVVLTAWIQRYDELKAEAEMAEAVHNAQQKSAGMKSRNKKSAGSTMNKAAQHVTNMLLLRVFHSWRMDSSMEHTMKTHQARIDAKRQQLVGVQQMFRNFASKLEGASKEGSGKDSSRVFDNKTAANRRMAAKGEKGDGARSLPEIKGSGRGPSGSARKPSRDREAQEASPDAQMA